MKRIGEIHSVDPSETVVPRDDASRPTLIVEDRLTIEEKDEFEIWLDKQDVPFVTWIEFYAGLAGVVTISVAVGFGLALLVL